ncbi:hypothetical protein CALVIDRAFT_597878 [Calocera viscosa TUFC12733]|uniref:Uncharacterized protein n=1 Tax=Calocera viscosa (strain TUFC12733) TaxID=1330018 RepID=A0A167MYG4_CALVF|nr:hypothetical protein CALVIDRAFT_597878 [Calocera viscosa TUFC12733]
MRGLLQVLVCLLSIALLSSARNVPMKRGAMRDVSLRETNAERMARGMLPLPPRNLYLATPVDSARKSRRSMAATNIQYSCLAGYQPECCNNQVINPDGSVTWTGCTNTGSPSSPFTCGDSQYTLCLNPGNPPFIASTTHAYSCPTAPYTTLACCDPENTNDCVDPLYLNSPPYGTNTASAFYCPNFAVDSDFRTPNCCTDDTYSKCANAAHQN